MTEARRTENVGKARQNAVGRVDAVHLSPVEESDAVALPRLVHDGGGDNDGDALLLQAAKHVPQLPARHRVHARGGFVQKQHLGLVDEGAAQGQLLLHAAREGTGTACAERFYLAVDVAHQVVVLADGGAEDSGEELEIFLHRQILVEREASGHIAHTATYLLVLPLHVETGHHGPSAVRPEQGGQ